MKKLIFLLTLSLLLVGMAWGQTTINFDDVAKWTAGSASITSYASNHTYVDGLFSATGGPALRNTNAAQDGFPGAWGTYAWRLTNAAAEWTITIASGGISTFSMDIRRWDDTPSPAYNLEYSTDSGTTWVLVSAISNTTLDNSSAWKTFNGTINSSNSNILIRLKATGTTERIHVDNFVWTGYTSGGNTPPSISNIVQTPSTGITSSTTVGVSATIIDSDGTVEGAELHWGTTSGSLTNNINMTASGSTYTTVTDIPVQNDGTMVYYEVYAIDDDDDENTSTEQSYTVTDPSPEISVSTASLTGFSYVVSNGPSAEQAFTLSGSNLAADINITAPTNYEISEGTDESFVATDPIILNQSSGSVASTTIYVRLKDGLSIGDYNSEVITASSTDTDDQTVTCSGSVNTPPPAGYNVDFEGTGETKGAYASGTVTLSDLNWDMTDALIGTDANDWKNGLRSARLRGYGTSAMTMLANVANAGTVSFSYRRYGTDAQVDWKVEYSTNDGTDWTQLGSDFTAPATDVVQSFSEELNVSGNVRIRIARATESGTSNRRLNIDDISLSDYTGGSTPTATPSFNPPAGTYYAAQNVVVSTATDEATVYYSTTSETGSWIEYSSAINVTETTTIWAYAEKDGMTDSAVSSATYTFPTTVSNIAALRAGNLGTVYKLTGEAVLTFQQSTRNQKYIQDATAAILIDDVDGNITTTYALYDGITGIIGSLSSYNGLLQFIPATDPGIATSNANVIVPEVRTLASLTSADQAKLIKVQNVTIDNTNINFGATTTAEYINVTQGETTLTLRTFTSTDYSGQPIPAEPIDMICLVGEFNTAMQVSPRFLADFITDPIYDYPEDEATSAGEGEGEVLITVAGGYGSIVSQPLTSVPNPNFEVMFEQAIELTSDDNLWLITVYSLNDWVACLFDNTWLVEEVPGSGEVDFLLELPAGKGTTIIELKSGNGGSPTLPVELSSFTVALNTSNQAVLTWVTQTETGVSGFYIYRNNEGVLADAELISSLIPATNSSQQQVYVYKDKELNGPGTYYYWLQIADLNGSESFHGPLTLVYEEGNDQQTPVIPKVTELRKVFPNPFNPSATISYALVEAAPVSIRIYNSRGQLVRSFEEGLKNAGSYNLTWNGDDNGGRSLATGVYYIRMQAGNQSFNKKAVLMK